MDERIVVTLNIVKRGVSYDIDIPTNISVLELLNGLNQAYDLKVDTSDVKKCYLKTENPIALLRGNKLIEDYKLRNGSIINYTE